MIIATVNQWTSLISSKWGDSYRASSDFFIQNMRICGKICICKFCIAPIIRMDQCSSNRGSGNSSRKGVRRVSRKLPQCKKQTVMISNVRFWGDFWFAFSTIGSKHMLFSIMTPKREEDGLATSGQRRQLLFVFGRNFDFWGVRKHQKNGERRSEKNSDLWGIPEAKKG